jgi:RNA polymerase sigma factor (sigma-70 family)
MGVTPPAAPQPGILSAYVTTLIKLKARQLAKRPEFRRDDRRDLEQELALRVVARAGRYDPARGASADTFANRVIHSEVRVLVRDRRRLKRGATAEVRSLDDTPGAANPVAASDRAADVAAVVASLPPDLRRVARRLASQSVADAARAMAVPRGRVYAAMREIRARFAAAGLGEP